MSDTQTAALALVEDHDESVATTPWHTEPVLRATAAIHSAGALAADRIRAGRGDDRGQSTAEYALVILGAAAVAALLVAWAGQTNKIGRLLDVVLDNVINRFR